MPYVTVETNRPLGGAGLESFVKTASAFFAQLTGKAEEKIMLRVTAGAAMVKGGTSGPAAYVLIKSIGLPVEKCPAYVEGISAFLERELAVPRERIYIDLAAIEPAWFGAGGRTFA
ncbi:MAG: hypothetical protein KKA60_02245 [Proteobacteria bacterium]|nr:hypothetical protein [Pseudomonadota bacterium]